MQDVGEAEVVRLHLVKVVVVVMEDLDNMEMDTRKTTTQMVHFDLLTQHQVQRMMLPIQSPELSNVRGRKTMPRWQQPKLARAK